MKLKKVLAFLLAAELLLTSLAACGKDEPEETKKPETDPKVETNAPDTTPVETEPAETEFDRTTVSDDLPEITFNGRDYRFITEDEYAYQVYAEEYTGEAMNDVIYERNERVQNRFDIKISTLSSLGMQADDFLVTYAQVGEHVGEVCVVKQSKINTPPIYYCVGNWLDVDYLDYSKPWWNEEAIYNHTMNDICFAISGDLSLMLTQSTYCMPFNMDLMEDWGYTADYLYNLVWDGEWTLDKLIEICSPLWIDVDGNNEGNIGDKFGFGTDIARRENPGKPGDYTIWGNSYLPWINALGEQSITIGEDRKSLLITLGTEKIYKALEKLANFHHNTVGVDRSALVEDFVAGNIGIYTGRLDYCYTYLNDINFSYGLLPFPKYDTLQENYITTPSSHFSMFEFPITMPTEDYDFLGIIMEAMTAESWKTVSPAYYEEALKGRYATDPDMARMVDLISESRTYDYSVACSQSLGHGMLPNLLNWHIADNDTDLASHLERTEHASMRTLAEILLLCFDVEDTTGILGVDYEMPDAMFGE